MQEEKSGNIYQFPLEHNLGYGFAELLDFSDISMVGTLLYIFDYFVESKKAKVSCEEIVANKFLFGPVTLGFYPNTRGKGAWKFICKNDGHQKEVPHLKSLRATSVDKDWSKLDRWGKSTGLRQFDFVKDYSEVRHLEWSILYGMKDVSIRASMEIILRSGKDLREFFDLRDETNRILFITIVNTQYSKEEADELLKLVN